MTLYPFSICRITAFRPSELERFHPDSLDELLAELTALNKQLEEKKARAVDGLYRCIGNGKLSDRERNRLIEMKRNVYNGRLIKDGNKLDECMIMDCEVLADVRDYSNALHQRSVVYEEIHTLYNASKQNSKRILLLEYADKYPLKNGVLFASEDLSKAMPKLKGGSKGNTVAAKKYGSVADSLLNYLNRSAAKTSPFSSFNTLALVELTGSGTRPTVTNTRVKSAIKINNLLYLKLKKWLLNSKDQLERLTLTINPTLVKSDGALRYFRHRENNEDFCHLPVNNPLLLEIFRYVEAERPAFGDFVGFLEEHIKQGDCPFGFANGLVDSGAILIHFPIKPDGNWLSEFISHLKNGNIEENSQLLNALQGVEETRKKLEEITDTATRSKQIGKAIMELGRTNCDIEGLNTSNLFYEDVIDEHRYTLEVSGFTKSFEEIKFLADVLFRMGFKSTNRKLIYNTLKEYGGLERIPLLEYYERLYLKEKIYDQALARYYKEYSTLFTGLFTRILQGERLYLWDFLERFFETPTPDTVSFDLYMQVSKGPQVVINNILHASGMNITRFYHLFPGLEKLLDDYRMENNGDTVIAQLRDSSIHNTQIQAPIADTVIDVSQEPLSERHIPLDKLYLRCLDNGQVRLEDEKGRRILPMDFSMESLDRRSSLFKFINQFSDDNTEGLGTFRELYTGIARSGRDLDKCAVHLPRIYLSEDVIIERESWIFPHKFLSKIFQEIDGEESAYIWFDHWRTKNKIPFDGFITYKLTNTSNRTKPQYINFKSPVYFKQFYREILSDDYYELIFKELLPEFGKNESKEFYPGHCKEFIINFTT